MISQLVLNIYERSNPLRQVRLTEAEYTVGRENYCQIYLQDSEVSRRHLILHLERSTDDPAEVPRVFLEDLNSTNGTIVNGQRVQQYQLQVGDRVQIGETLMTLELQKVYKEEKPALSNDTPARAAATPEDPTNLEAPSSTASLLGPRTEAGFFDPGFAPISDPEPDSVDVTVGSAEDQDRILRTISHTEGEKLLSPERTEKLKAEGTWANRAQGFLHLLYEMTLSISRCTDIDRLTAELLDMIFQWVDADRGCILLFDSSSNRLIPRAKKVRDEFRDQRFIISKSILDYVLEHQEGVWTSNAQDDERWDDAASVLSVGIHEAICVPLQGRYGIVGAIYLDTFSQSDGVTQDSHRFGEEYLKLMITIAHHTAIAVEDTRYYRGMLQAERLAAIGQTVATLSHHIKNILQGIQGGSYLIQTGLEMHKETFISKGWKIVERNQNRISALILDMLTFSKERKPELVLENINRVVQEVVDLMRDRAAQANVILVWQPDEAVPDSLFDPEAINHAVLNLVTNAIDAVAEEMGEEQAKEGKSSNVDLAKTVRYDEPESI
nr:FHA domain-containing protein [Thermoguttaceae bacterium]